MSIENKNVIKNNIENKDINTVELKIHVEAGKEVIKDNIEKTNFEKHQKNKEKILNKIKTSENLSELKQLVEKWIITQKIADKIRSWNFINKTEIEEIFTKINEIEEIENIDKYLPKEFRITKEEYIQALENKLHRIQTITKLDLALNFIVQEIEPWNFVWWINVFWSFLTVLDNNLKKIQENTIDIKDSLTKIDKENQIDNRSLWQKILDFLIKLFK